MGSELTKPVLLPFLRILDKKKMIAESQRYLAQLSAAVTDMTRGIVTATTFLLSTALAAMGLETDLRKLKAKGLRPLLLGLAAFLFIACFSLLLVKLAA